ncbi:MAG: Hpt domain-containing protein [Rhodospirillaceae bacterium]
MTGDDPGEIISELRELYLAELSTHCTELVREIAAVADEDMKTSAAVLRRVHRLAGTASMFGLVDIGELAEHIEITMRERLMPGDVAPAADLRSSLQRLVELLTAVLERARDTGY